MKREIVVEMKGSKTPGNGRWWEFYFVRYFVGTVLGMVVVAFLNFDGGSALQGKILPNMENVSDIDFGHALVLAAIGLAFCYISSAPVLVLHALRGVFSSKFIDSTRIDCVNLGAASIASIAVITLVFGISGYLLFDSLFPTKGANFFSVFSISTFLIVVGLQLHLYVVSLLSNKYYVFSYYKSLAVERAKRQDGTSKYDEFIESYKHLREHGNAFFILLMELVLALVLFSVEKPNIALLMALLWVAPACFVWFLGTYLELSIGKLEDNV